MNQDAYEQLSFEEQLALAMRDSLAVHTPPPPDLRRGFTEETEEFQKAIEISLLEQAIVESVKVAAVPTPVLSPSSWSSCSPQISKEHYDYIANSKEYHEEMSEDFLELDEDGELAAVIALSIQEFVKQQEEISNVTERTIICPRVLLPILNTVNVMNFLKSKLGVQIKVKGNIVALSHKSDPNILEYAVEELRRIFDSPDVAGPPPKPFLQDLIEQHRNKKINVFVDNSNIFISAQFEYDPITKKTVRNFRHRVNVKNLAKIVEDGRSCTDRVVVGSLPPSNNAVWQFWKDVGYTNHLFERIEGRGEDAVDDAAVAMMYRSMLRCGPHETIVVLTGDGNDNEGRANFHDFVEQTLKLEHGPKVELWCWELTMSRRYKKLLHDNLQRGTGRFSVHYLDFHRDQIVFNNDKAVAMERK